MSLITLIRPPSLTAKWVPALVAMPPLAHAYLAGTLTAVGHHVSIIDAVGEKLEQKIVLEGGKFALYGLSFDEIAERIDARTDLIGLSCMFTQQWPAIRSLLKIIRKHFPRTPIACGGEHVTAEPEFSLKDSSEIDFCVLGEGEETLLELANSLAQGKPIEGVLGLVLRKNGQIIRTGPRPRITKIDEIPLPSWDLTLIRKYLDAQLGFGVRRGRSMPLLATRGCPYQCTFCSNPEMWTTRWLARSPSKVIEEMELYIKKYDASNFDFYDLTAIIRRDWIIEFCKLLLDKKWPITWQLPSGTRSEAIDEEVCNLLYQSGCRNISYSPESGSPAVLKRIKKRVDIARLLASMRSALGKRLNVKCNIVLGFPGETHREIFQTMKFILRIAVMGIHDLAVWLFVPYPGSELFHELRKEGKIRLDDEYFLSLSVYSDYSRAVSWNRNMGAGWLKFYRLFGTLMFYFAVHITHPVRVVRTIRNLIRGTHESRAETVLAAAWARFARR